MSHELRTGRMTLDEFYELPEDDRYRHELEAGLLVAEPQPNARHGIVAARLVALLSSRVDDEGVVFSESGFLLADEPVTLRAPDVALVLRERISSGIDLGKAFPGAPDLAIEVLSPGNTRDAIRTKVAEYLSAGTRLVWVVDPQGRTVTAYARLLEPRIHVSGETVDASAVLPRLAVAVDDLFRGIGFDEAR